MDYREELFKALTTGIDGVFRDKSIDALVEVCKAARKEGYNAGFENSNISDSTFDEKVKEAYENGANDAWECVRKIFSMPVNDVDEIFPECQANICEDVSALEAIERIKEYDEKQKEPPFKIGDRVRTLADKDGGGVEVFPIGTIGEVVEVDGKTVKVKADGTTWYYHADALELANDAIIVGDEVTDNDGWTGVVMRISPDGEYIVIMQKDGAALHWKKESFKKTGRHFPQIAEVLKQMKD